tara:strand:- start:1912 stop:2553 length:642 start_codon:yes stop_codon:yes gene_type:complete
MKHREQKHHQIGLMGVLTVSNIECVGMSPKHSQKGLIYSTSERARQLYVTVQMEFQSKQLSTHKKVSPEPPQRPKTTVTADPGNNYKFINDRFHFVLHDIVFHANDKVGKNVFSLQNFIINGEEVIHETEACIVLRVFDNRSRNSMLYGTTKTDKFLGSRRISLNDFVKSDNHYYLHEFGLDELKDYHRSENGKQDVRKLAVKLEWRLAKKRG